MAPHRWFTKELEMAFEGPDMGNILRHNVSLFMLVLLAPPG
jgi:hypothetical protein